jgi:septal ring factor EnvC (AmiA/AmiB activator)
LKNSLSLREKEIKALTDRLKASGERESKLEAEIDDLRNKLIKREQKSNESIHEQRSRLDATYTTALESIKSDHAAALRLEGNKLRDLQ